MRELVQLNVFRLVNRAQVAGVGGGGVMRRPRTQRLGRLPGRGVLPAVVPGRTMRWMNDAFAIIIDWKAGKARVVRDTVTWHAAGAR